VNVSQAEQIAIFLQQQSFPPAAQSLGEILIDCCTIVQQAVALEVKVGEGKEKDALREVLELLHPTVLRANRQITTSSHD
jgi:hypothetical protein